MKLRIKKTSPATNADEPVGRTRKSTKAKTSKPVKKNGGVVTAGTALPAKYAKDFKKVQKHLALIQTMEADIETAKREISDLLTALKADSGIASFKSGDFYYSIRTRGGKSYVVKSDVPFGSWRKKGVTKS